MKKQSIFLVSLSCPKNHGDFVLKTELNKLLSRFGLVVGVKPSSSIFAVAEDWCFAVAKPRELFGCLRRIGAFSRRKTIFLILSPGGLGGNIDSFIKFSLRICVFALLRFAGVKILHMGVSTEKGGALAAKLLSFESMLKNVTLYRDTASLAVARSRGEKRIADIPDFSFLLGKACKIDRKAVRPISCLLSFRRLLITDNKGYEQKLEALVAQFQGSNHEKSARFYYQVDVDKDYQQYLASLSKVPLIDCGTFPYDEMKLSATLGSSRYIISNRLHVLLLGMFYGALPIPVVTPSENQKILGLFSDAGLRSLCFDLEQENCDIDGHIKLVEQSIDQITEKIDAWIRESAETIEKVIKRIVE